MINFDCHAHVFETTQTMVGARYAPKAPALLTSWLNNLKEHGLKGGVIIQVSFLGTDNSQLCSALSKLDKSRFAGVTVVALDIDDSELDHLVEVGVRGVRWNLVRGVKIPDIGSPRVQKFLEKLRTKNLHLEVHLEGSRLARNLELFADQGINIVVDHFGLPSEPKPKNDPFLRAVGEIPQRENIHLKLSAQYRTPFDLSQHLEAVKDLLPSNQMIWGSDWPHTQHEMRVTYETSYQDAKQIDGLCDIDGAGKLYGISIG